MGNAGDDSINGGDDVIAGTGEDDVINGVGNDYKRLTESLPSGFAGGESHSSLASTTSAATMSVGTS